MRWGHSLLGVGEPPPPPYKTTVLPIVCKKKIKTVLPNRAVFLLGKSLKLDRYALFGGDNFFQKKDIFFGPPSAALWIFFQKKVLFFSGPPSAALWYTIIECRAVQKFERPNVGPP